MTQVKYYWQLFRKALKGEHGDFTQGIISDSVILLAVPMILELSLESVFAVVDMFFVSKLGQNAIATVGLTESVITIVYSIAIGISTGAGAVVARRVGEKNAVEAAHAGAQSITISVLVSIFIGFFGVYFASDILRLMGAHDEVIREGTVFTQILLGGNTVIVLLFLINGIFRGAGDAAMAMRSLWLASGVNIILCPLFIHFWGLKGAAIATVCGRAAGVLYQMYYLFVKPHSLKIEWSYFRPNMLIMKSILNIAWPASFQFIIGSGSWILLTRLVAETGGTAASAGYQIAFRNFVFFILPAWGLSNAAATLVGQNLGAKKIERAEQSVNITAQYSFVLMALVTLFFIFMTEPIVKIFSHEPEVIAHATTALKIIASGYIFYGLAMVVTQSLNGAGDSKTPTWINFICYWVFQTPLAYFLAKNLEMGAKGVIIAIPISQAVLALVAWIYFKKGKWKTIKI